MTTTANLPEYYTPSRIDWSLIPPKMRQEIHDYIQLGILPGDFVLAVVQNDLKETFRRADEDNIKIIGNYVNFFYNYAPSECWRSKDNVSKWHKLGGLDGAKEKWTTTDTHQGPL